MQRINPVNNNSIISLIDNTQKNITDSVYIKGYSELERLVHPNQAIILESDKYKPGTIIFAFEFGIKKLDENRQIIDNNAIIIAGNELVMPGVIVKKTTLSTLSDGFEMREGLEYFQVVLVKDVPIKTGTFIIISKRQCQRLNIEDIELFFIWPKAIALMFDIKGFKAGPEFVIVDVPEIDPWTLKEPCYGLYEGKKYYYKEHEFEFTLHGKNKKLIAKNQLLFSIED